MLISEIKAHISNGTYELALEAARVARKSHRPRRTYWLDELSAEVRARNAVRSYTRSGQEIKTKAKPISERVRFLKSAAWKELRLEVLAVYGSVCMCCGSVSQIQVDHIKPRSRYPNLALVMSNMQVLCWPCNKTKSARHETDYRHIRG